VACVTDSPGNPSKNLVQGHNNMWCGTGVPGSYWCANNSLKSQQHHHGTLLLQARFSKMLPAACEVPAAGANSPHTADPTAHTTLVGCKLLASG
jgi:hypothetical protein